MFGIALNSQFAAGVKTSFFHNTDTISAIEPHGFFRYSLPWLRLPSSVDGPYAQTVVGAVFISEGGMTYPAFSGGLSVGWRFNLPINFYVEPEVRFSYPSLWGVSLMGGFKFQRTKNGVQRATNNEQLVVSEPVMQIETDVIALIAEMPTDEFIQVEMPEHQIQLERGRILNAVYFEPDTVIMIESYRSLLDDTGLILREDPSLLITLRGYAAPAGTAEYLIALSRERAILCGNYLVNNYGIAQNRITIEYFGADQAPEFAGANLETWRCVEVILHD